MSDKIYLRLVIDEDGRKMVVDQDDREVSGLIGIASNSCIDNIDEITITCADHYKDGSVKSRGGHNRE